MPSSADITDTIPAGYTVVRLNRENCKDLARLYTAVHGRPVEAAYFEKKYNTQYTGHSYTGLLAYTADGEPVAFNGLQPCFITYNGSQILAAQNIDLLTHPAHRQKGLFTGLSLQLFSLAKELGIYLLFGFPNQNSHHVAINSAGWKMTEQLSRFSIPVKPFFIAKLLRKLQPLFRLYRSAVLSKYRTKDKGIAGSVISDGFAGVLRDKEYLDWKTYHATTVIRIGEAKIWFSDRYLLMIGDMENVTEKNFTMVMQELCQIARRLGVKEIQFHASPATSLHRLWEANYTKHESYPLLFQDFDSAIDPEKIKFNFADIDIF